MFGVADFLKIKDEFNLPKMLITDLDKAICLGVRLSKQVLNSIGDAPTKLYFHHYKTANFFLDQLGFRVAGWIQRKNALALPIPASQIVDWEKQSAHLSHKKVGVLAGLGWIGRNNLLVNEKLGSQFRLITILTDMNLKAGKPTKNSCGKCFACLSVCPAETIKKEPNDFDHHKCFEKLKEFQKQHVVEQYICGVCVKACKGNKK